MKPTIKEEKATEVRILLAAVQMGIKEMNDEMARLHLLKGRFDEQWVIAEMACHRLAAAQAKLEEATDATT